MTSSGMPVDPACRVAYDELKGKREHKFIIYAIVDKKISVLKKSSNPDYAELLKELPPDECRWAVYDANFELPDGGKRQKICLISWIPEAPKVRSDKMVYSTSKSALRSALIGEGAFPLEIQATDQDEADQATLEFKLQGKLI